LVAYSAAPGIHLDLRGPLDVEGKGSGKGKGSRKAGKRGEKKVKK